MTLVLFMRTLEKIEHYAVLCRIKDCLATLRLTCFLSKHPKAHIRRYTKLSENFSFNIGYELLKYNRRVETR